MDFDFIPSHNDLGSDLDVSSPSGDRNKIYDPGICIEVESTRFLATLSPVIDTLLPFSSENEDKVFNHGVLASKEKSPPSSSHRAFKASKLFHHKSPMLIHEDNTPNLGVMEFENSHNNALAKLPMLKLREYEMWEIRIKQYFQIQDYALWEVIENGNLWVPIPVTTTETGPSTGLKMTVPSTAEEKTAKKNDYVDAQSMFATIKARFGGNKVTRKTQKALLKQQYENFNASSSESLDSIFNRLQKLVSRLAILGVVTPPEDLNKVKKSVGTNNDDKNLAFLTTSGASSTNIINTANPEVSTEQLHDDDLEEMDLKWNMALLSMRARKFYQRTRRKIIIDGSRNAEHLGVKTTEIGIKVDSSKAVRIKDASEKAMCAIDGAGFDWSDMAEEEIQANMALMAITYLHVSNRNNLVLNRKTVIPTATKKEFVKLEKPVRRLVRSVNTGRPFSTARSFNTVRPSYTAHPKSTVHCPRPRTYFQNQAQSTVQRPFYKKTALTKRSYNQNVNTDRARGFNDVKPSAYFKDFGMEYDVTYGGVANGKRRITGKVKKSYPLQALTTKLLSILEHKDVLHSFEILSHDTLITVQDVDDSSKKKEREDGEVERRRPSICEIGLGASELDDQDGISSIPNSKIFEQLALMGYHTDSDNPKKSAWEQFSSNIATAVICLATNRKYNFSRMIFEHMVSNISSPHKFLMYHRFIQICLDMQRNQLQQHSRTYLVPSLSVKVFNNMKRPTKGYSGQEVALFPTMLEVPDPSTSPSRITSSPSPSPEPST
ncbi:hypothetical protein Tco_0345412 [Tanacetum coccineum]